MAFPDASIPILDSGNRADEDPISNSGQWSHWLPANASNLAISANHIAHGATAGEATNYWNPTQFSGHIQVAIQLKSTPTATDAIYIGACLQNPTSNTLWGAYLLILSNSGSNVFTLNVYTNAAPTTLIAATAYTPLTDDIIGLDVSSGVVKVFQNNTQLGSVNDATWASGYLGLGLATGSTNVLNNFYGGSTGVAYTLSQGGGAYATTGGAATFVLQHPQTAFVFTH